MEGASLPIPLTVDGGARPSRADWDRLRSDIKRLYVDENRKLTEVMAIMARDYGHQASIKMYKSRITKWNLEKNTKEAEAWTILRKKIERDAAGRDSKFRVREKPVTAEDVLRYFKRKGILDPLVESRHHNAPTPPTVQCYTPSPLHTPDFTNVQIIKDRDTDSGAQLADFTSSEIGSTSSIANTDSPLNNGPMNLNVDQARQILFSGLEIHSFEIPSSPLPPQSLLVLEKLFASIKAYVEGAARLGHFRVDELGSYIHANNNELAYGQVLAFNGLCNYGVDLMLEGWYVEGRRALSKACGLFSQILRNQHSQTLVYILNIFAARVTEAESQILRRTRSLMGKMAIYVLLEEHPWKQLFTLIGTLDDFQARLAVCRACFCFYDVCINSIGQFHPFSITLYRFFSFTVLEPGIALDGLLSLQKRAEEQWTPYKFYLVNIKQAIYHMLAKQGRFTEALPCLEDLLVDCRDGGISSRIELNIMSMIAQCKWRTEDHDGAVLVIREAINVMGGASHVYQTWGLHFNKLLAAWLGQLGRKEEADTVRAELNKIIGSDDLELENIVV